MKKFQKFLSVVAMFFFFLQAHSQFTINFKFHPYDPDSCIVSFVDTVKNEVIRSFTLVEYSPYWNLAFPEIVLENVSKKERRFDFQGTNSIGDIIPGLVTFEEITNMVPSGGETYSTMVLSKNSQYIIIIHYMLIWPNYTNEESGDNSKLYGRATVLHIYNSRGEQIKTYESSDVNIIQARISDNGKYLAYTFDQNQDMIYDGDWKKTGFRILDIDSDSIIVHEVLGYINGIGARGNAITVTLNSTDDFYTLTAITYFPDLNLKYEIQISRNQLNRLAGITEEGYFFYESSMNKNIQDAYLLRFEDGFTKSVIK